MAFGLDADWASIQVKNHPIRPSRSVKELLSARRDLIDCPSSLVL